MDIKVEIIYDYLLNQNIILSNYFKKFPKQKVNSENYAVIIEPRSDHKLLEAICRNVMYFLPNDWNLIIYSSNEELVRKRLKDIDFTFYKTSKESFNAFEYSELMMTLEFWNNIPGKNILIFQTDSYIMKPFTEEYINKCKEYPYIGCPYLYESRNKPGINILKLSKEYNDNSHSIGGGFSFRNKDAMIDCIKHISIDNIIQYRIKNNLEYNCHNIYYEDFYFEQSLFLLGYKLPSMNVCFEFCTQVIYNSINPYAVHGIYRNYVYTNIIYFLRPSLFDMNDEVNNKIINGV